MVKWKLAEQRENYPIMSFMEGLMALSQQKGTNDDETVTQMLLWYYSVEYLTDSSSFIFGHVSRKVPCHWRQTKWSRRRRLWSLIQMQYAANRDVPLGSKEDDKWI